MKFVDYISDKIFSVVCFVVSELLIASLLWLVEVPFIFIVFVVVILLAFFMVSLLWDFGRRAYNPPFSLPYILVRKM